MQDARRLAVGTYFVAVALTSSSYIAGFTLAAIVAPEMTGWQGSSGLPSSVAIAGTAMAATLLSGVMARRGRRIGLVIGIGLAVAGAAGSLLATAIGSFPLLLLAGIGMGSGNAAVYLARYAAADLYPPEQRARPIAFVVWGSTIGAVLGPNLITPAETFAPAIGLSPLAGAFVPVVALSLAALAVVTFGPRAPLESDPLGEAPGVPMRSVRQLAADLLRNAGTRTALAALLGSQLVMVLVMTMTPVHLHGAGHGLGTVGFVISAHVLGMFAFAPLTGWLVTRFGPMRVIPAGLALLASSSVLAAVVPASSGSGLAVPLLLLGLGWNLGFVGGSSMLAAEADARVADQTRRQGVADAMVWAIAAFASLGSGLLLAVIGFAALSLLGAVVALAMGAVIGLEVRSARRQPA